MARRRNLPPGFRRASGGVSESQDAARRKRVQKEKERIAREAKLAKARTDRQAKAFAAPRSVFIPRDLRRKPKPKPARKTFAADKAARETYVTSGGKTKRRQATKEQRRRLQSAQSAKRQRLARLALERPARVHTARQPRNILDAVPDEFSVGTSLHRLKQIRREQAKAQETLVGSGPFQHRRSSPQERRQAEKKLEKIDAELTALGLGREAAGFVQRFATDLVSAAEQTPAGLVHLAKSFGKDVETFQRDPTSLLRGEAGRETAGVVEEMGRQTIEDLRHPLRHPGYTALTVAGLASMGAGMGVRGTAAARAVAAGKGVRGAARAATHIPRERRFLEYEGEKVPHGLYSKAPITRAAQKARDKRVSAARYGKAEQEVRRYEMQAAHGQAMAVPRFNTLESMAVKVVAEGVPVEQVLRQRQAVLASIPMSDKAIRNSLSREIVLLDKARKHLITVDGKPALKNRGLQRKYERYREFSRMSEREAIEAGLLDPARAEARIHAPGRIHLGARYVSKEEVKRRIAAIDGELRDIERGVEKTEARAQRMREQTPGALKEAQREKERLLKAGYPTKARARRAESAHRIERLKPLLNRAQRIMEIEYDRFQRGEIGAGKLARQQDRLARLEGRYAKDIDKAMKYEEEVRDTLTLAEKQTDNAQVIADLRKLKAESLQAERGKLEGFAQWEDELENARVRVESQAQRIVGFEEFKGGDFYIPERVFKARGKGAGRGGYGGGVQRKMPGQRVYTGMATRLALGRRDIAEVLIENHLGRKRWAQIDDLRTKLLRIGKDTTEGMDDPWAVRERPGSLPVSVKKYLEGEETYKFSRADRKLLDKGYEQYLDDTFLDPANVKNFRVKYVEKATLADELNSFQGNILGDNPIMLKLGQGLSGVNDLTRLLYLYLKPAYMLPNVVGNAFLLAIKGGFADPKSLQWSVKMASHLGDDVKFKVRGVMGSGFAQSLSSEGTPLARGTSFAAEKWSLVVDDAFRDASFLHSARQLGYKTKGEIRDLVMNPDKHDDFLIVAHEANRDLIDYSRLGPREKKIVRNLVFLYPFMKGSTLYTARFLEQHPIQAATFAQLGRQGEEEMGLPGPVPSFMKGSFELGGRVVNPAAAQIFGTPAEVGQMIAQWAQGNYQERAFRPSEFISPALAWVITSISGRDIDTGEDISGEPSVVHSLKDLGRNAPLALAGQRIYRDLSGEDQSKRLFPMSWQDALWQLGVGGIAPRDVNYDVMHRMAAEEQGRSGPRKAIRIGDKGYTYDEWLQRSKRWNKGKVPQIYRQQARLKVKIDGALSKLDGRERTLELIDLAADVYPQELSWREWARKAPEAELEGINREVYDDLFRDLNDWNRQMADQGF